MGGLRRFDLLILLLLLIVQLAICIPFIQSYPIELDEPFTIYHSSRPLGETVSFLAEGNNPPLYFFVQHAWQSIFGTGPIAVRSLSLLISLITISVFFVFIRKRAHILLATGASLVLIFADSFHHFSMEARMFQLYILFSLLALISLYRLLIEREGKAMVQLVLWCVLALYTHYLAVFVIGVFLILIGVYFKRLKEIQRKYYLVSAGLFLLMMMPLSFTLFSRGADFVKEGSWLMVPTARDLIEELFKLFTTPFNFLFFTLFITMFIFLMKKGVFKKTSFLFFLVASLSLFLGMFVFSLIVQPVFHERYLFVSLVFMLPMVVGFNTLEVKIAQLKYAFLGLALPFMLSVNFVPDINRNTDELVAEVGEKLQEGYSVYYCPQHFDLLLSYHFVEDFGEHDLSQLQLKMGEKGFFADCAGDLIIEKLPEKLLYIDFNLQYLYPDLNPNAVITTEYNWIEETAYAGGYMLKTYHKK